mgnify:CR=1 FL=1
MKECARGCARAVVRVCRERMSCRARAHNYTCHCWAAAGRNTWQWQASNSNKYELCYAAAGRSIWRESSGLRGATPLAASAEMHAGKQAAPATRHGKEARDTHALHAWWQRQRGMAKKRVQRALARERQGQQGTGYRVQGAGERQGQQGWGALLAERLVVLIVKVEVLHGREVLDRGGHLARHLVVVEVERDELAQVAEGGKLGEVCVEPIVLHAQVAQRRDAAELERQRARNLVGEEREVVEGAQMADRGRHRARDVVARGVE